MSIIGTTADGGQQTLDLVKLTGAHLGVVANSGGGKSGLLRRILETTHGQIQQIILDVEDEFYTLRERYDYVIAGGEGGDMPAPIKAAESLAIAALTHGFSLIVQLNELGPDGANEFIGRFLTAMVDSPRDLWHPVLVIVDEVQRSAPRVRATEATDGIKALAFQGRKRGFTAILAGTKFTEIDPSVRGMVNNWMLGRVGQAVDRNTMAEQLGFTPKEGRDRLRNIEERHFYAMGAALSREPVLFGVSDVETTPIHAGQAKVPTPPAPEALREILAGLVTVDAPIAAPAIDAVQEREWAALRADRDDFERRFHEANDIIAGYQRAFQAQAALLADISWPSIERRDGTMPSEPLVIAPVVAAPRPPAVPIAKSAGALPPAARKMIDALAKHYPRALPLDHITKMAVVSMKSSQWRTNLAAFAGSDLVKQFTKPGFWELTTAGRDLYNLAGQPDDPAALIDFWMRSFTPSTAAMLRVIVNARGASLPKLAIAEAANVSPTSSGLTSGLRELRDHGLIQATSGNTFAAAQVLL